MNTKNWFKKRFHIFLLMCSIFLTACNSVPRQGAASQKANPIGVWDRRESPPTADELSTIKKIVEAIKIGKARDLAWWAQTFDAVPSKTDARWDEKTTLRQWFDRGFGRKLEKCPAYVHDGIGYGCIEEPGSHLKDDFASFLVRSGLGWETPITIHKDIFSVRGRQIKNYDLYDVGRYEFTPSVEKNGQKIVWLSIEFKSRYRMVELHLPLIHDLMKMPRKNFEKYLINDKDGFLFVGNYNGLYHYPTPCYLKSILNGECMSVDGGLSFDYFYFGGGV
ncbi:MAG: hypothetical protein NTZ64_16765 [Polaromonas sp.]|nr:hypothetical protein [Polaromonas sp.]